LADKFNLGTYSKGVVRNYTFTKTGSVALLCNVHQEMEAYIVVLKNPYYAVTDRKGHFEISDVPPGSYRLTTWHNKLKPRAKEVVVPDQGAAEVKFKLRR
ncbi:MAG: methylamine utilization protein, partial [Anaerolineae bacterium]|nr:methylamine utilization protein [Anaerolineae bacterium]